MAFVVSTTLHAIWVERLRRMDDASLSQQVHTASATTILCRSVRMFRVSTYQPDMGEDGQLFAQVRSALANSLSDTTNLLCCTYALSNCTQECSTSSFSIEDHAEIRVLADLDLLLSDSTLLRHRMRFVDIERG